jgi:uncharacterized membrane protein
LFLIPFAGMALGAAGDSALFVMARNANAERVLSGMSKFGGTVIKTNLTAEQQAELEEALSGKAA